MRKIIVYSSKTGNTKKIAESIAERINPDVMCDIKDIDVTSLNKEDIIFIGGWIDKGYMNKEVMEFIEKIENQKVAFFFTLGAYPNSMHTFDCIDNIKNALLKNNNEVLAHYHCQGAIDPKLISWMKELPEGHGHAPDEDRINRWNDASKHPNQEDFNSAKNFASALLKRLVV